MQFACDRGTDMLAVGDGARAAAEFGQALRHVADVSRAFRGLGDAQLLLGDPDAAVAALRAAVLLRPNDPESMLGLGLALDAAGQRDAAELVLREAAALADRAAAWWSLYAVVGADAPATEQLTILQRLVELEPDSPHARALYGAVLLENESPRLAERFLLTARQLAPRTLVLEAVLLQLHGIAGRVAEARLSVGLLRDLLGSAVPASVTELTYVAASLAMVGERSTAMQALARASLIGAAVPRTWTDLFESLEQPRPTQALLAWARRARGVSGALGGRADRLTAKGDEE